MNPFSDEADADMPKPKPRASPPRLVLPKAAKPLKRDALARPVTTLRELGEFVHEVRTGFQVKQAELAARAEVSRSWLVALEQGRQTVEAGKVMRTLEALGFEIVLTPYDPPPPWMVRAMVAAQTKKATALTARYKRKNTKRERARLSRLVANIVGTPLDLG